MLRNERGRQRDLSERRRDGPSSQKDGMIACSVGPSHRQLLCTCMRLWHVSLVNPKPQEPTNTAHMIRIAQRQMVIDAKLAVTKDVICSGRATGQKSSILHRLTYEDLLGVRRPLKSQGSKQVLALVMPSSLWGSATSCVLQRSAATSDMAEAVCWDGPLYGGLLRATISCPLRTHTQNESSR